MQDILAQLPHRPPFLLVDRVIAREPGTRVVAEKMLTLGDPCFQGHFEGNPVLPGVLMLEMLAQAAGFLEAGSLQGQRIFLAGVQEARFKAAAFPGDRLELEVRPEAAFGGVSKVRGEIRRQGQTLCTATLLLKRGGP